LQTTSIYGLKKQQPQANEPAKDIISEPEPKKVTWADEAKDTWEENPISPHEYNQVNDAEESLAESEDIDEDKEELTLQQKSLLNKLSSMKDDEEEPVKGKRKKSPAQEPEAPVESGTKKSLLETQKGMFILCGFAGLQLLENFVSTNVIDIHGTVTEVQQLEEAREAMAEIVETLIPMPTEDLDTYTDPFTRLAILIFLVALNKYQENKVSSMLNGTANPPSEQPVNVSKEPTQTPSILG